MAVARSALRRAVWAPADGRVARPSRQSRARRRDRDHIAGISGTRRFGAARRGGQPGVARQGDARPGKLHQRQREPAERRRMTQVGITGLPREVVALGR